MSEMVKRVARAICDSLFGPYDPTALGASTSPSAQSRKAARAAIEAMREPTVPMLLAAVKKAKEEQVRPIEIHRQDATDFWQAMIDAALSE